jgi:hypothetical protein
MAKAEMPNKLLRSYTGTRFIFTAEQEEHCAAVAPAAAKECICQPQPIPERYIIAPRRNAEVLL